MTHVESVHIRPRDLRNHLRKNLWHIYSIRIFEKETEEEARKNILKARFIPWSDLRNLVPDILEDGQLLELCCDKRRKKRDYYKFVRANNYEGVHFDHYLDVTAVYMGKR